MLKIQQQTSSRQCLSKHQGYLLKTLCGTMMSIAVIVGAAMMTTGCSSEEPTDNSGQTDPSGSGNGTPSADWAPDSPVGKIIGWSEHNSDGTAGNKVRIEFSNATDIKTNFSDWTTYTYTKKSAKKAHLNFMAPQNVAGTVRTFQYDLDIVFTSASEFNVNGTLKVNYLSGPNVGRTVYNQFTGNGKYFTSLWGN